MWICKDIIKKGFTKTEELGGSALVERPRLPYWVIAKSVDDITAYYQHCTKSLWPYRLYLGGDYIGYMGKVCKIRARKLDSIAGGSFATASGRAWRKIWREYGSEALEAFRDEGHEVVFVMRVEYPVALNWCRSLPRQTSLMLRAKLIWMVRNCIRPSKVHYDV